MFQEEKYCHGCCLQLIFTSVTSPSAGASVPDTEISAMEVSDAEFEDALEILESLPRTH